MKKFTKIITTGTIALTLFTGGVSFNHPTHISADSTTESSSVILINKTSIPFGQRTIQDNQLPSGVQVIDSDGENGVLSHYKSYEYTRDSSGNIIKIPKYFDKITLAPQDEVIRIGTANSVIDGTSDKTKQIEAQKAAQKAAEEAAAYKASVAATSSISISSPSTTQLDNISYAKSKLSSDQFACLNNIAVRESGWRTDAQNGSSGAYGIPQALPGSKMSSVGSDWKTNGHTQVDWMISYVNSRYGSACGAWSYWQSHNNY